MKLPMRTKWVAGGIAAAAVAAGGAGIAIAGGDDDAGDSEQAISGTALERAEDAALAHTGEGAVTATEVGDEESRYEVEVTLDDGTQTDVQLDGNFEVVGSEGDSEEDE